MYVVVLFCIYSTGRGSWLTLLSTHQRTQTVIVHGTQWNQTRGSAHSYWGMKTRDLFLESPDNLTGPKPYFIIKM